MSKEAAKAILAGVLVGAAGWMVYKQIAPTQAQAISADFSLGLDLGGQDNGKDTTSAVDELSTFAMGAVWMGTGMKTSLAGIELIKRFEGFRPYVYDANPPKHDWTIGYGHKLKAGESYSTIDDATATRLLIQDVADAEDKVNRYVKVQLNQAQFDALVSFAYNVTTSSFIKIAARINNGAIAQVPGALQLYVYAGGKKLAGLVSRRAAEAQLFAAGVYA